MVPPTNVSSEDSPHRRPDMTVRRLSALLAALVVFLAVAPTADSDATFRARLTSLPIDAINAADMTGSGSVSATLQSTTLLISGEYKGLGSPATVAHLHRARQGLRGPVAFQLTITKTESGTIEG